jgi:hypothetical protein
MIRVPHHRFLPLILRRNRQTEICLVLRLKPRNRRGDFEAQISWFCGPNWETVTVGFKVKLLKTVAVGFKAKPLETVVASFEAKPQKTVVAGFEAKPPETVTTSFEVKPEKSVATSFEAKLEKTALVVLRPNH